MTLEPENTPMIDEPEALEEAFKQIFGMGPYRLKDRGDEAQGRIAYRFIAMLDCGAYLDAAMMLVPAGAHATVSTMKPPAAKVGRGPWMYSTTPALALLGAIREARKNDA